MKLNPRHLIPALSLCCIAGAAGIMLAMRVPVQLDLSDLESDPYQPHERRGLELEREVPSMEAVVEKHLFSKERKASAENSFSDLLVKGVYIGDESNVVLSLKSNPEYNLRVWMGDESAAMNLVKEERDPRREIVTFLVEWDIKEITFSGVTFENLFTGEVETYAVDYTPTKQVKDNAAAGYGQGLLAEVTAANAKKTTTTKKQTTQNSGKTDPRMMADLLRKMSPEDRMQMFQSLRGDRGGRGGGDNRRSSDNRDNNDRNNSNNNSSRSRSSSNSGSSNNRSSSGNSGGNRR